MLSREVERNTEIAVPDGGCNPWNRHSTFPCIEAQNYQTSNCSLPIQTKSITNGDEVEDIANETITSHVLVTSYDFHKQTNLITRDYNSNPAPDDYKQDKCKCQREESDADIV